MNDLFEVTLRLTTGLQSRIVNGYYPEMSKDPKTPTESSDTGATEKYHAKTNRPSLPPKLKTQPPDTTLARGTEAPEEEKEDDKG